MIVTIAHLYYDLMNLYGESGNIKALKYHLENQGIQVKIILKSIYDKLDFSKYDVVYIGMGTEENQKLALKHLKTYDNEIKKAMDHTIFLVTGNALDLFGKSLIDKNGKKYKGLHLFSYITKEEKFRTVGETVATCTLLKKPIIGFQNRSSIMKDYHEISLFKVQKGNGYAPNQKEEGVYQKHFYGTYLIGPILVRNPEFLKYLIKQIIILKDTNYKLKPFHFTVEKKAYDMIIQNKKN